MNGTQDLDKQPSVGRGIVYGASCGIIIAELVVLGAIGYYGSRAVMPGYAWVMMALPGTLTLSLLLGLPVAALTVAVAAALYRRWRYFRHWLAWVVIGVLFTTPYALFFNEGHHIVAFGVLGIGALSGLAAWFGAMKPPQIKSRNSASTAL